MKYLAVFFSLFIITIIILADRSALPPFVRAIYDFPYGDKVGHFILTLTFLPRHDRARGWVTLSVGLILAVLIAAEEFSQKYFASRTFDLVDLAASYVGLEVWKIKNLSTFFD